MFRILFATYNWVQPLTTMMQFFQGIIGSLHILADITMVIMVIYVGSEENTPQHANH